MESNRVSSHIDVKLDIYNKRPEALKFRSWTRCMVTIEPIKCFPCFLRINIKSLENECETVNEYNINKNEKSREKDIKFNASDIQLSVSIIVPGVTISLAISRTKSYSYGLFWTHNRRDCFIYFALETESSCRKHMKWIKKAIKSLEQHRQLCLDHRRNSRGPNNMELRILPRTPPARSEVNCAIGLLQHMSHASDSYEEIWDNSVLSNRFSRRYSRSSVSSGIYEEMKPCAINFDAIREEWSNQLPPLPPLPPPRNRINTYDNCMCNISDLPRSNTDPDSETVKKKKNRNMLNLLFTRSIQNKSTKVVTTEDCNIKKTLLEKPLSIFSLNSRYSFSSPDLSIVNFGDSFDKENVLDNEKNLVNNRMSSLSLNSSDAVVSNKDINLKSKNIYHRTKSLSMENLNLTEHLSTNFNFSACNSSSINLLGASGAVPTIHTVTSNQLIIEDDLTGYCVMAPIKPKCNFNHFKTPETSTFIIPSTKYSQILSTASSGYSTSSVYSTQTLINSNIQFTKETMRLNSPKSYESHEKTQQLYNSIPMRKTLTFTTNDSNVYENMQNQSLNKKSGHNTPESTGNLYENLLRPKDNHELEHNMCTSTPTDPNTSNILNTNTVDFSKTYKTDEEDYYQTPRKSLICIDEKVTFNYPNTAYSTETNKDSESSNPQLQNQKSIDTDALGLKQFIKLKILAQERKENLYISSPLKIIEQRRRTRISKEIYENLSSNIQNDQTTYVNKRSRDSVLYSPRISSNFYSKNWNNNKILYKTNSINVLDKKSPQKDFLEEAKLQTTLLPTALLQSIDFRFDDRINNEKKIENKLCLKRELESFPKIQDGYDYFYRNRKEDIRRRLLDDCSKIITTSFDNKSKSSVPLSAIDNKFISPMSSLTSKKITSLPRIKRFDLSVIKEKVNSVLQRQAQTPSNK